MLELDGITKRFGGFVAVNHASMSIARGEVHAVIGPNGAGKSTLFNLITGHLPTDEGEVRLNGKRVTGLPPHGVVRSGMGRSFQLISIFPKMSVRENVQIALVAKHQEEFRFWRPMKARNEETMTLLDVVGLTSEVDAIAGQMSYGKQKQLELALALAGDPEILLLDEPTAGMSPRETEESISLVMRIKEQRDLTLLFTEHDMQIVFGIAHRISVLHHGEIIASGTPEEVRANRSVQEVYLGKSGH